MLVAVNVFRILFALMFALATRLNACDMCAQYCTCETRPATRGVFAGVFEQFTHFGTLQEDGDRAANPIGQYLDSSITQFIIGDQFTDWCSAQLNLPFIYRGFRRPEGFNVERGSLAGIGDMSLLGNVRVYRRVTENDTILVGLTGGVKFPTGSSGRLREEINEIIIPGAPESGIHGHDLALGSGSYDGVVGANVFGRWKRFFGSAQLQYAIRSAGSIDYRYANDLTWNGGPGAFLWFHRDGELALQCNVSGESKGKDKFRGETAEDTAVTIVYIGPELMFSWKEKLRCECGADLPVVRDNSAFQIVPDYRLHAAATWRF
jgi:hypothetical protein